MEATLKVREVICQSNSPTYYILTNYVSRVCCSFALLASYTSLLSGLYVPPLHILYHFKQTWHLAHNADDIMHPYKFKSIRNHIYMAKSKEITNQQQPRKLQNTTPKPTTMTHMCPIAESEICKLNFKKGMLLHEQVHV